MNTQIYFRSVNFFIRLLYKELSKSEHFLFNQKSELLINILLFFINKIYAFCEIINKYVINLYKEERKILDNFSDNLTDVFKFNTDFKNIMKNFLMNSKILIRKINIYFDFDVGYHFNNFVVTIDKDGKVNFKIKPEYQFKKTYFVRNVLKLPLLNEIMNLFLEVKKTFTNLITTYKSRLEFHLKVFEVLNVDKLKKCLKAYFF